MLLLLCHQIIVTAIGVMTCHSIPNALAFSVIFLTARTDGPFAVNPIIASLQSLTSLNADNLTSGATVSFGIPQLEFFKEKEVDISQ